MMNDIEKIDQTPCEILTEDFTKHDLLLKLIIIGSSGVGKTCLLLRALKNDFKDEHDVTIGVEFGSMPLKMGDHLVKLQIWDTAGQETYKSVTRVFYKGAHCIFLVYDVTSMDSFKKLKDWLNEVRSNAGPQVTIILIGNKIDDETNRVITKDNGLKFMEEEKLDGFFETSAKSGENSRTVFLRAAKFLYMQNKPLINSGKSSPTNFQLKFEEKAEKSGSCPC